MKKTELKKLIKEAFLTEKKSNLLNENSPGFDNRKQGGALPTLESVKAAYQAKKLKEASAEEEIESTKELTAAVRDLDDAKKDAGLNEDEFAPYDTLIGPVVAGMVEIRKYVENVAPEHLKAFEIADNALMAFNEKMAYVDEALEETIKRADAIIAESKMEKEFKDMYAATKPGMIKVAIAHKMNNKHLHTGGLTEKQKEGFVTSSRKTKYQTFYSDIIKFGTEHNESLEQLGSLIENFLDVSTNGTLEIGDIDDLDLEEEEIAILKNRLVLKEISD